MNYLELLSTLAFQTSHFHLTHFFSLAKIDHNKIKLDFIYQEVESLPLRKFLKENGDWWIKGEKYLKQISLLSAKIIHPLHKYYPKQFFKLEDPPLSLSLLGDPCWENNNCISIVGSRTPTSYSLDWMEEHLDPLIYENSWVTVSGAAYGIDQKAHALSLRNKLPTIAFLPSGILEIYPSCFKEWIKPILNYGGAILSEYAPEDSIKRYHFHKRNRMISMLSNCILIIEAKRRSGSLMTANICINNDLNLAVIPGHPLHKNFLGSLDLIYSGVQMIRDKNDLRIFFDLSSHSSY